MIGHFLLVILFIYGSITWFQLTSQAMKSAFIAANVTRYS